MIRILAERSPWSKGINLLIAETSDDPLHRGITHVARPVVMERASTDCIHEPTMKLAHQAAQDLIDSLWECGLRPTEGAGSAGQLAATERHLADMRRLVFEAPK